METAATITVEPGNRSRIPPTAFGFGGCVLALLLWAYWPTLVEMEHAWAKEADYSHGYLVLPAALFFLFERRSRRPNSIKGPAWGGLSLLLVSGLLRYASGRLFLTSLDGWSIPFAIGGILWLALGRAWIAWSWPCIAFLVFMVPLPWRVETYCSVPLQKVAATCSTWGLQCLGFSAIQEGNTIVLGITRMEVEQACNGLRMLIGVTALTFGLLIVRKMEWWQRVLLILSIVPISLAANCIRIIVTGLLFQWVNTEWAQHFSHDLAGWLVIPLAAAMLWAFDRYLGHLIVEYQPTVMTKPG
jgi:exosortase